MATHNRHDHERGREQVMGYITEVCREGGMGAPAIEKVQRIIAALHDLSCEIGFEMVAGVRGIGPEGERVLDLASFELIFDEGEPFREAAALKQMQKERSN